MAWSEILPLLLIPFAGTTIGSAAVLFLGDKFAERIHNILLGFASGVMVAASVWSLLIPAMEESASMENLAWIPAVVGFLLGVLFMLLLDTFTPHLHPDSNKPEGPDSKLGRSSMLVLAVTLHNIPEGMAVGVVAAGVMTGELEMSFAGAMALAIGLAIQNIPEGAIISLPLRSAGNSRKRAFAYGTLSGIVEPLAAIVTILFIEHLSGALVFVVIAVVGTRTRVPTEKILHLILVQMHVTHIGVHIFIVIVKFTALAIRDLVFHTTLLSLSPLQMLEPIECVLQNDLR